MLLDIFIIIAGFIVLIYAADFFVRGASSLARKLGVSPFVIGLTVVAIGTSAPELFVNVIAAIENATALSIGNILGSNITDILLGLGLAALFTPLAIKRGTTWKEIPFSLLSVALILVFGLDKLINGFGENILTRSEGIALLGLFIIFIAYTFGLSKEEETAEEPVTVLSNFQTTSYIIGGILTLVVGGKLVVSGAVSFANLLGLSQNLIGLTIVAIGTSLPEIATAVIAARKKHVDLVIGGIVGTVIFNSLFALGSTAVVRPLPFSFANAIDAVILLAITLVLFISLFVGKKRSITKEQGLFFIALYVVYIIFAIMRG